VTAKNIWLAENVLEILTEQRYGWSGGAGEGWCSRKRAAAGHGARESARLPAERVVVLLTAREADFGALCLRGWGFLHKNTLRSLTERIFKPWHKFLPLGALLLQAVCGRVPRSPSVGKAPLRGSQRGRAAPRMRWAARTGASPRAACEDTAIPEHRAPRGWAACAPGSGVASPRVAPEPCPGNIFFPRFPSCGGGVPFGGGGQS